ncbi:MAG: hypothetical protein ACYC97_02180 [Metallibacterium sp.]
MYYVIIAIIGILAGIPIGYFYHKSISIDAEDFLDRLDYIEARIGGFFNKAKADIAASANKDESVIKKDVASVIPDSASVNPASPNKPNV